MSDLGVTLQPFDGDRHQLDWLFALADDSAAAIASYRDKGSIIVAVQGERIAGLVLIEVERSAAEIVSLAVDPALQGTGVGGRLVSAAIAAASRQGARRVEVATAAADIGNLRFYQRQGFRFARIERDAFTPANGYPEGLDVDGIPLRDRVVFDLDI